MQLDPEGQEVLRRSKPDFKEKVWLETLQMVGSGLRLEKLLPSSLNVIAGVPLGALPQCPWEKAQKPG